MEEEFKTSEDVQKWLAEDRNVPLLVAAAVASTLFAASYCYPSSLLNIQREDLSSLDISPPHRNTLFNKLQQQQQPQQLEGDIAAEMQAMRLEIHGVRETLPLVLVGNDITPSQASRIPQVVSSVFDSLGLSLLPRATGEQYELPTSCGDEWKFSWKWKSGTNMDDRGLERTSYKPVEEFLRGVGLFCVDVSEGQYCVEKLLHNVDVYTKRNQNPLEVRSQQVFLRHRVQGRSDLAVLRADNEGGYMLLTKQRQICCGDKDRDWLQTVANRMHEGGAASVDWSQRVQHQQLSSCCAFQLSRGTPSLVPRQG